MVSSAVFLVHAERSDALLADLRQALQLAGSPWAGVALERLRDKGLAHDHVRLVGVGVLARIPKQSQMGLTAADNLLYQRACFERACAGGHAPQLLGWLEPSAVLPRGALLVQEISGRSAFLPQDLSVVAQALAALHKLPLLAATARAPLLDPPDPLQALQQEIAEQARYLAQAQLAPAVATTLARELALLHATCAQPERPPKRFIAFDGHPGNFIVRQDGRAVLVDLEKCRYGYPGLDLAHATLYTSTTWDVDSYAELSLRQVLDFYSAWEAAVRPQQARAARRWQAPLRRAMALWSLTWCAKWRVLSGAHRKSGGDGEDWSAEQSDAALIAHVRNRVDHYLSAAVVARMQLEFQQLERALTPEAPLA